MRRVLVFLLESLITLLVFFAGLLAYDFYKNGMSYYTQTPQFQADLHFDGKIALTSALIVALVHLCYDMTRKTLRMGPPPPDDAGFF